MSLPRYTISVCCFNNLALTKACVRSVMTHSLDYELIVTDNASTDGTKEYLAGLVKLHPGLVRVVTNTTNQGFKEPQEHALTLARGEFFVMLNNDVQVCAGWLDGLREPFNMDVRVGIVGVEGTCSVVSKELVGRPAAAGEASEYVEASCAMLPTAVARQVGLFAPYLKFAYWEDADLSFRLREAGYRLAHVKLPINHDRQGATSRMVPEVKQHYEANTKAMEKRWKWYFGRRDVRRRILVKRGGAHGDVLLLTPALWELRQKYPLAEISVLTKCPQMLAGLEWLTPGARRTSYYDEVYDLDACYEKRPEVHIVEAFADALGVKVPKWWQMKMAISPNDEMWAVQQTRGQRTALIHPGPTCWPGKNWPVERFVEVVKELGRRGYVTIAVGGYDIPDIGADLAVGGKSVQALYALARVSQLFVGIDSMPQHVASAADCPSVVLFGPTNPRCIVRPTPKVMAVQADVRQVPCVGEHGRRKKAITQAPCDGACMRAISVEMVMRAVERVERLNQ